MSESVTLLSRWLLATVVCVAAAGCDVHGHAPPPVSAREASRVQLPTGARLDPAVPSVTLGSMPLAMAVDPSGRQVVVLLNGWREQGIQVFDRASGRIVQTVRLPAVFLGMTFSRTGDTLFVSGGYRDVVYEFAWENGRARLIDSIPLAARGRRLGQRYPAGMALSPDGRSLYVAENLSDSLAIIDIASQRVRQRLPLGRYPYTVVATSDGRVFASAWGDTVVSSFTVSGDGSLVPGKRLAAGRHPSALLLDGAGSRLFVASASTDRVVVLDARTGSKLAELLDPPPTGPGEGSTPNALALSRDERRLYVAEADNNAVAVFELAASAARDGAAPRRDTLVGRVPADEEDRADQDLFNRVLWQAIKGDATPYPGARRASVLELRRAQ